MPKSMAQDLIDNIEIFKPTGSSSNSMIKPTLSHSLFFQDSKKNLRYIGD